MIKRVEENALSEFGWDERMQSCMLQNCVDRASAQRQSEMLVPLVPVAVSVDQAWHVRLQLSFSYSVGRELDL